MELTSRLISTASAGQPLGMSKVRTKHMDAVKRKGRKGWRNTPADLIRS